MKRRENVTAREYLRVVEWSPEDRSYVGSAPPLIRSSVAARGRFLLRVPAPVHQAWRSRPVRPGRA